MSAKSSGSVRNRQHQVSAIPYYCAYWERDVTAMRTAGTASACVHPISTNMRNGYGYGIFGSANVANCPPVGRTKTHGDVREESG
jgi:hypothetical protein